VSDLPIQPDPEELKRQIRHQRYLRRLRILFPILLVLIFLVYAFTTNFIPSDSMMPTLRPGDHILTMRAWLAYPFGRMPERGDIIIFNLTEEKLREEGYPTAEELGPDAVKGRRPIGVFRTPPGQILIKRVIGLPGEEVSLQEGGVYINGRKLPADYPSLQLPPKEFRLAYPYGVIQPLKLKEDELFVLGDNPNNSEDGRFWGALKRKDVIGKYIRVLWHEDEDGPNFRRAREEKANQRD
jgi:signal peptidase I